MPVTKTFFKEAAANQNAALPEAKPMNAMTSSKRKEETKQGNGENEREGPQGFPQSSFTLVVEREALVTQTTAFFSPFYLV